MHFFHLLLTALEDCRLCEEICKGAKFDVSLIVAFLLHSPSPFPGLYRSPSSTLQSGNPPVYVHREQELVQTPCRKSAAQNALGTSPMSCTSSCWMPCPNILEQNLQRFPVRCFSCHYRTLSVSPMPVLLYQKYLSVFTPFGVYRMTSSSPSIATTTYRNIFVACQQHLLS